MTNEEIAKRAAEEIICNENKRSSICAIEAREQVETIILKAIEEAIGADRDESNKKLAESVPAERVRAALDRAENERLRKENAKYIAALDSILFQSTNRNERRVIALGEIARQALNPQNGEEK